MITLTKINNQLITINDELIEVIEETPDTIVTLTTGRKVIVKESKDKVLDLIKEYRRELYFK